jgi:hypothetical protein
MPNFIWKVGVSKRQTLWHNFSYLSWNSLNRYQGLSVVAFISDSYLNMHLFVFKTESINVRIYSVFQISEDVSFLEWYT